MKADYLAYALIDAVIDQYFPIIESLGESMEDFQEVNKLYGEKFPHAIKHARQTLEVSKLPLNALIEISCIAFLKN